MQGSGLRHYKEGGVTLKNGWFHFSFSKYKDVGSEIDELRERMFLLEKYLGVEKRVDSERKYYAKKKGNKNG
jgi:hypothetical protein